MPIVPFDRLPDDARVWIFAASDRLTPDAEATLFRTVDDYLEHWHAHGEPLTCARDWQEGRFLAIGVDQSTAGASGCSIDGLFRSLQNLQRSLGTALVGAARIFYRGRDGAVVCMDRATFQRIAAEGNVGPDTAVFDLAVTSAGAYRQSFEVPARATWHKNLI